MLSSQSVGTYQGNKLTSNLSGNACPQSSQLPDPLWTDLQQKESELVFVSSSPLKKSLKKGATGSDSPNLPLNPRAEVNAEIDEYCKTYPQVCCASEGVDLFSCKHCTPEKKTLPLSKYNPERCRSQSTQLTSRVHMHVEIRQCNPSMEINLCGRVKDHQSTKSTKPCKAFSAIDLLPPSD